ncbi:hypothetical protein Dimus_018034 [Dionaea muscipula]
MGKPKANVPAKREMEKVSGVKIVPHFFRIEDKDLDFYSIFNIIVLGLDSVKAWSYISIICDMHGNKNSQTKHAWGTLKSGIENMLMHYVPEVKGVVQELDAEDEEDILTSRME